MKFIDRTGHVYSRLTVLSIDRKGKWGAFYKCRCICGKESVVSSGELASGGTRSCGCLVGDTNRATSRTHGGSKTAEYYVWNSMKRRCGDSSTQGYERYGGRGIKVCDRWMEFGNFIADMGKRPQNLTLERIDNNGNYEPGNCCWATRVVQANNRRSNRVLTHAGVSASVSDWARRVGVKDTLLWRRIFKLGWSLEAALGGMHNG